MALISACIGAAAVSGVERAARLEWRLPAPVSRLQQPLGSSGLPDSMLRHKVGCPT